ncbi:MAG: S8 family serine peptidase [Candidatus Jordarchaeales archaeon]
MAATRHFKALLITLLLTTLVLSLLHVTNLSQGVSQESSTNALNGAPADWENKIDPEILSIIKSGWKTIPVIVVFNVNPEVGCAAVRNVSPESTVEKIYTIIPAALMKIPSSTVYKVAGLPEVRYIWLNRQVRLASDSQMVGASEVEVSSVEQIWNEGFNGSGVIVAILDSGVDSSHPDLDDLDDDPSTMDPKVIASVSMVDYDPFPYDFNGHGTYVAGIVAGTGYASNGSYKGVAPGSLIMNVKVFDVEGLSLYSWILSGLEWSVSHGADVVLIAFSIPGLPDDPLCLAVDAAVRMGVVVVAAAGDGGPAYMSIGSPGSALGAITVGAYNSSSGKTCTFSGRGPSLYMWTKPDVVAPGHGIASCRSRPPDLGFNISIPQLEPGGYGTPIDEYYVVSSSTAAAAAYVAGLAAILLQLSMYASPESVKIAFMRTAVDLGESPNVQGAGLVDPYSAYSYLKSKGGISLDLHVRTYTPGLTPAPLFVNGTGVSSYCLVGSYGTFVAMSLSNRTANFNSSHILYGMFGVSYNGGKTTWLTTGTILRELHISHINETTGYEKLVSVVKVDCFIVVMLFECWSNYNVSGAINAFKITVTFLNTGDKAVSNVRVVFFWNPSLFLGESGPPDEHGFFNSETETLEVGDTSSDGSQVLWLAFKGNLSVAGYEVGRKDEVFSAASSGLLSNKSEYFGDLGLAAVWLLSDLIEPGTSSSFAASLSFGEDQAAARESALEAVAAQEQLSIADLCLLAPSMARLHGLGADYTSECVLLNVGNIAVNASAIFFANRSGDGSTIYYAEEFKITPLKPYEPVKLRAVWRPTSGGAYSVGWVAWSDFPLSLEHLLNPDLLTNATELLQQLNMTEFYLLDNYMARNAFIGSPPPDQLVFPAKIPCNPFPINFPVDLAYYNLSVILTGTTNRINISIEGNASKFITVHRMLVEVDRFGTVEVSINTTTPSNIKLEGIQLPFEFFNFPNPGWYSGVIAVTVNDAKLPVSVSFSIDYPQGRILFDSSHNLVDVEHIEELLDSTFTGYFSLYEIAKLNLYELDEIPFLQEINKTILRLYDTLIVCDPDLPFSPAELEAIESFVKSGGSLLVMVEPENLALVNELLEPYGIRAVSSVNGNITITSFKNHRITSGLSLVTLYSPVVFEVDESKGAFALTDEHFFIVGAMHGDGRVVVFGDSDFASLFHVEEGDNSLLLFNTLEWLMARKLSIDVIVSTPKGDGRIRLGDRVYFLIHVTSIDGDTSSNLSVFAIFNLPNGTSIPMWCFHYKDGYYTTLLFTELIGDSGDYTLIIWADSPKHVSSFKTLTFTVLPSPPETPLPVYQPSPTQDIIIGFLVSSLMLALAIGAYIARRMRFQSKTFIPELDRELAYHMRTTINELRAVFKELDLPLSDESIDDFEKIRIIHEKLPRLKRILNKLKTLAEMIGE